MYSTVEPLLRGNPDKKPPLLERPLDSVNLNINVLISTTDERPPLLKGHFSCVNGVASQEGFHCSKDALTENTVSCWLCVRILGLVSHCREVFIVSGTNKQA